jgi:hypothetical protein
VEQLEEQVLRLQTIVLMGEHLLFSGGTLTTLTAVGGAEEIGGTNVYTNKAAPGGAAVQQVMQVLRIDFLLWWFRRYRIEFRYNTNRK